MNSESENLEIMYCCEVEELSDDSDISYEYISIFGYNFSLCRDEDTGNRVYKIFFHTLEDSENAIKTFSSISQEWQDVGVKFGSVNIIKVEKKDWSQEWKKYFDIQHLTDSLTIKPSWLEYVPKSPNEVVIEIDPGMSFGTGGHATTRFCLKMLDKLSKTTNVKSFLDAGCGSGILTAAAYKLGFSPIVAFDYDPVCIKCTEENLQFNNINPSEIKISQADITEIKMGVYGSFDFTIVNILAHILYDARKTIVSFVKPNSYLALAGIVTEEYPKVKGAFCELGFKEIFSETEAEWTSGLFQKI
jgi:ribosomal protein L11 methyltransferase